MPSLSLFDLPTLGPGARIEARGSPEAVQALHRAQARARDMMVGERLQEGDCLVINNSRRAPARHLQSTHAPHAAEGAKNWRVCLRCACLRACGSNRR